MMNTRMPCICGSALLCSMTVEHAIDDLDDVRLRGLEHVETHGRAGRRGGGGA